MRLLFAKILLRLLSLIPLRLLHALAVPLGRLAARLPSRKHSVVTTNLALCFPELDQAAVKALHRRNMIAMAQLVLEAGAVWHWPREKLLGAIAETEGLQHFDAALARGRGVILVGAHMANWEILNLFCATLAPMVALYRAPGDPAMNTFITRSRERTGARLVPSGSYAMRHMIRQLRQGGTIGLLCDQQPKQGEGVFAPFFGTPALTMTLVNRLCRRTGCAVVFTHCERLEAGRGWKIVLEPAPEALADTDPVVACTALNAAVERQIRQAPEDYLWLYKRFGIRPPGAPEVYPRQARKRRKN